MALVRIRPIYATQDAFLSMWRSRGADHADRGVEGRMRFGLGAMRRQLDISDGA